MAYSGTAVLPTGTSMNPMFPDGNEYYSAGDVIYVMFKLNEGRTRPTRVLQSAGALDGWKIDSVHVLYHDQTGAQLGTYKVVGVKVLGSGEAAGQVPDIAIKHAVFK